MSVRVGKLGIVRLDGDDLTELRWQCYERDDKRCSVCDKRLPFQGTIFQRAHMAHIVSRGAGGSDVLENVQIKCYEHHIVSEHGGGKVVPAKPRLLT